MSGYSGGMPETKSDHVISDLGRDTPWDGITDTAAVRVLVEEHLVLVRDIPVEVVRLVDGVPKHQISSMRTCSC